MKPQSTDSVECRWARVGVLLHCAPSSESPDIERLLLDTVCQIEENARLFPLAVTWLVEYGNAVAKHRLKRLACELHADQQPALALILESAIANGAPKDLAIVLESCRPSRHSRPLFKAQRGNSTLEDIAARNASAISQRWGIWAPEVDLKKDALRPVAWILEHNKGFRDRIVRKGDLRCSILETLRWDSNGRIRSEAELARLSGATRTAVRKALSALVQEGEVRIVQEPGNLRDHAVLLAA